MELCFRIPAWSRASQVAFNGKAVSIEGALARVEAAFKAGDRFTVTFTLGVEKHVLNNKVAFTCGPYVLARDERKEGSSFGKKLRLEKDTLVIPIEREVGEEVRLLLHTQKGEVLLTDYASCGKHWTEKKSNIAVWQPVKKWE